jgi:hypothetical protein
MYSFHKWLEALLTTVDEESIKSVMRDYRDTLERTVLKLLPGDCQQALKEPDIQAAAVALLHCEMRFKGSEDVRELLHEIAHTYAAAALRVTALHRGSMY